MNDIKRASILRNATLPPWPFPYDPIQRSLWESGDIVVAEVLRTSGTQVVFELDTGREVMPMTGDLLVGAFGVRYSTLEATGSWEAVKDDRLMHLLTAGGVFGRMTSISRFSKSVAPLRYLGHVLVRGHKANLMEFVAQPPEAAFDLPVVLIVGTSMSSGKTYAARVATRVLRELGHVVVGAKLTGAGRWHDMLALRDAGATAVFDFVDAGMPTTVCDPELYREAITGLMKRMAEVGASVAVIEAGASPLEPYNGGTAVELLNHHVAYTILCATDPYAVVGIRDAWERNFDLVAGPAANTVAGVQLVDRLTRLPSLDLMSEDSYPVLRQRLGAAVGSHGDVGGRASTL